MELSTGRIRHYLVSRSDPRLPGSSRWRLSPDRIVDQQPGQVSTGLSGLDDLPLARASVRQELLRRSRRWRDQVQEETSRLRDQFQQAGDRFEERFSERLEGWLEEPEPEQEPSWDRYGDREPQRFRTDEASGEAWDDWDEDPEDPPLRPTRSGRRPAPEEDDPWV